MKCYSCGARLTKQPFCPSCGADVRIYRHIIGISNSLYNDGLKKAQVRDLSGAVDSLKRSLKYNKKNIDSRNLLGLVYFEMGEVVLALSEWIISKNFDSQDNIANEYITRLQSNPAELNSIDQSIKMYNQALQYCYQDTKDLAEIHLKRVLSVNKNLIGGYQLLSLLYINRGDFAKARRTLLKSLTIDVNNTLSRYYLKSVDESLNEIAEHSKDKKQKQEAMETIRYESGNDTIIKPAVKGEKKAVSSIVNILIGLAAGMAICWFLLLPARIERETAASDEQYKLVSNELATEKANALEISRSIETLQAENEELTSKISVLTGTSGEKSDTDRLFSGALNYINDSESTAEVMDELTAISPEYLKNASPDFKALYEKLSTEAGQTAIADYLDTARSAIRQNDYASAIEAYTRAFDLDKTNSDILINLGHAYRKSGDTDKADEIYRQVISSFPDSENAVEARDYITNG